MSSSSFLKLDKTYAQHYSFWIERFLTSFFRLSLAGVKQAQILPEKVNSIHIMI